MYRTVVILRFLYASESHGPLIVTTFSRRSMNAVSGRYSTSAVKIEEPTIAYYKSENNHHHLESTPVECPKPSSSKADLLLRTGRRQALERGAWGQGDRGQKKRFKDALKANLKKCIIDVTRWEETKWHRFRRRNEGVGKSAKNKPWPAVPHDTSCPKRDRVIRAKGGLIQPADTPLIDPE